MFRAKTISTISTITSQSLKPLLQSRDSLFKRRNSDKSFMSNRMKKEVKHSITLGKVYLIVRLCASEIAKRGLVEPDIFNPAKFSYEKEKARYLINCILRDKRVEFEDELKCQNVHNVIVGIRMALRNCVSNIISYDNYKVFAKHEHECQYDPNNESFNGFLSYLPRKNKGILVELFDLFAVIMENSHVNLIHPTRILKSMSLYIFNESQTKKYEDFQLAYQDWLKYSNATIHLFLAYLRERTRSTTLPDRLNLLLHDYAECRKKCFTNNIVDGNEKDIVFGEHPLPDITITDLDEAIISNQNFNPNDIIDVYSVDNDSFSVNTQLTYESSESSLHEFFPEIMESLAELNFETNLESFSNVITINDLKTAKAKWKELQDKELGILSEEALKLFFDYDSNLGNGKKKRNKSQRKYERFITSKSLPDKNENDSENIKSSNNSTNINSNSFTSTVGPILSDNGDNSTTIKLKETRKQKKIRKSRMILSFLCFKCYMYTDDPNYSGSIYEGLDEKSEQWGSNSNNLTHESELDKNQFLIQSNSTDRLSNRISLSSVRSLNRFPSQQFDRDIHDRSTTPIERMEETFYDPFKSNVGYRTKVLQQNRFRRLYQDDFTSHDPSHSPIGYISMPTQFKRSPSISSNMSESSSIFGLQSIIRGKELPYPVTPLRFGRQSPIYHSGRQSPTRAQYFRQYSQQYPPRQYSQQYPQQRYFSQQYLQQFPQYPRYPQQQPIHNTGTNTNVIASTSQHYNDDYDYIESKSVEDYDAPYQLPQSQQQPQLYNQQEGDYYQHSQEEE